MKLNKCVDTMLPLTCDCDRQSQIQMAQVADVPMQQALNSDFANETLLSLIDWISDTRPQGSDDLQSLVKCLDHRC